MNTISLERLLRGFRILTMLISQYFLELNVLNKWGFSAVISWRAVENPAEEIEECLALLTRLSFDWLLTVQQ